MGVLGVAGQSQYEGGLQQAQRTHWKGVYTDAHRRSPVGCADVYFSPAIVILSQGFSMVYRGAWGSHPRHASYAYGTS